MSRLFSGAHRRSPVSRRALGECNAITSRGFGHSELTFVSALEPSSALPKKLVCGPRQRSAEGIPGYSQITDNTQRRCGVHKKSGKEIKLNGLVGSVPSSIPQTSC